MKSHKASLALSASLIALLMTPATAHAQSAATPADDKSGQEGDIVITATRQDLRLSKVPISVAAFSAETMDRQGVRSVADIARITPGLTFTSDTFGGDTSSNIAIRGVSSSSGAATTGIYIDDVAIQIRSNAQTAFGSAFPRVFDLDRIEVLRGPQGTLFGAGAQGGVVRFITPSPSLTKTSVYARTELSATEHGDPSYEGGVALGVPLIEGKAGLRVSGYYRHDGGFVDRKPFNVGTPDSTEIHPDANSSNTLALRGAAAFQLSDTVLVTPSFYYQRVTLNDTGALWGNLTDAKSGRLVNGYSLRQNARDRFLLPSLTIAADLGPAKLTSVTSYFDRKGAATQDYTNLNAAFIFDTPFPFVPGWQAPGTATAHQKAFSQEVRLSSVDPAARIRWTAGAYYSHARQIESIKVEDLTVAKLLPLDKIFGIGATDGRYVFTSGNNTLDRQWALFAQADVKLTDKLSATLGLRYSKTEFDYSRSLGGPLNYSGSGPETVVTTGKQNSKPFTPKFGLSYTVDDNNLLYASAAKGFRVGGVNPPLFASCQIKNPPATFGPDTTWSFEAGSKNKLFGGALRTEASVFYIKWDNIQQFVLAGCAGNGFRDNIGAARSRGFDLQFFLRASDRLQFSGSIGYVDAKFTKTVVVNQVLFARKGDALAGPPWQLAGNVDYRIPAGNHEFYLHADARRASHNNGRLATYDDPTASGFDPTLRFDPAVTEVDLRAGLRIGGVDASLFVNNLFDAAPLLAKSHDTETSPLYYYRTIRPRTLGLTVGYRY
ncbi:MAG: TonB-dependent receptor [Sphingomonas sp.]|nr:TonB-dependent receptor [Sphingomonas sp.]